MANSKINLESKPDLFKGEAMLREFDADAAEAELRVRLADLEQEIAKLDEAQVVSNEALLLEFSV